MVLDFLRTFILKRGEVMKPISEILESKDLKELETYIEHYELLVEFFQNRKFVPPTLFKEQELVKKRYRYVKCMEDDGTDTSCRIHLLDIGD